MSANAAIYMHLGQRHQQMAERRRREHREVKWPNGVDESIGQSQKCPKTYTGAPKRNSRAKVSENVDGEVTFSKVVVSRKREHPKWGGPERAFTYKKNANQ